MSEPNHTVTRPSSIESVLPSSDPLTRFLRRTRDPVLGLSYQGDIVFANASAAQLFGYAADDLHGEHVDLLFPKDARELVSKRAFADIDTAGTRPLDCIGRHRLGAELSLEIDVTPVETAAGILGICTIRDVTDPKRMEQRVAMVESRTREAQRIAKIGNWEWDVVNGTDWWSEEIYKILHVDPAVHEPSFTLFLDLMHAADRELVEAAIADVLAHGGPYAVDVRVTLQDGVDKIVHTQGEATFTADGRAVRVSGTLQDVTERKGIESALRRSETRYKEAQRIAKVGNWEWNLADDESWWSDELYSILEEEPESYAATFANFVSKIHPDDRGPLVEGKEAGVVDPAQGGPVELRVALGDGREKVIEQRVEMRPDEHGRPSAIIGTVRDVTERRELENQLRESEERYSSTVELAAVGIAHVDPGGRVIWANPQLCEMLGYSTDELTALTINDLSHSDDLHATKQKREQLHNGDIAVFKAEKRYVRKDGGVIWVRITSSARRNAAGEILYDVSVVEDVSDRRAAEERVQYLATHDELTGLPNRALFGELVHHSIESARRAGRQCAVLFIDLDRFKIVNDSLGHDAGDLLLKEMAARLSRCLRKSDAVARLGGDEFVVLLTELTDAQAAAHIAKKILSAALEPIEIMGLECRVTASIGIASYPDDASDALSLMKHADEAMYSAKEEGKNNYQFYSPEASPMSVERLELETLLGRALGQNEFSLQYQAKVNLKTGVVNGTEALLRWWNPKLGTVSPVQFIPVAEDTGLIVAIGKWVLQTACRQNVAWQRQGLPPVVMSVNLSPRQFKDPALLDDVAEVLEQTGMAPELLELEITESMIMHNVDQAARRVEAIKKLGVRLALDDFGTGYSSLSQLKRFPIDTLKVDRSFVKDIPTDAEDRAITEAIISLGKTLGVTVVAEGVETAMQQAFLSERACDEMQGFHFSRPCHPDAFAALLASTQTPKGAAAQDR